MIWKEANSFQGNNCRNWKYVVCYLWRYTLKFCCYSSLSSMLCWLKFLTHLVRNRSEKLWTGGHRAALVDWNHRGHMFLPQIYVVLVQWISEWQNYTALKHFSVGFESVLEIMMLTTQNLGFTLWFINTKFHDVEDHSNFTLFPSSIEWRPLCQRKPKPVKYPAR